MDWTLTASALLRPKSILGSCHLNLRVQLWLEVMMTEHVTGTGNKAELTAPLTPDKLIQDLCGGLSRAVRVWQTRTGWEEQPLVPLPIDLIPGRYVFQGILWAEER